jgi:hypothetical protein
MPTTPIIVQLNLNPSSQKLGTSHGNYSFYDPLTGVNLNKSVQVSSDLSGFSAPQLHNIANAVFIGTLTCTSGASELPAPTASFLKYGLYMHPGASPTQALKGNGITGVAAADSLENNF